MPTASRSGSRRASRLNSRSCNRALSRPGLRARRPVHPLTGLAAALRALIRFHQAHPDWFPPPVPEIATPPPVGLDPEWVAAIEKVYGAAPLPT